MAADVKVAIDMNRFDEPLQMEMDTDTLSLDAIIQEKLTEAIRLTELEAPHSMLEGGYDIPTNGLSIDKDGKGSLKLPDDFLRLVAFKMSDWRRTVFEAITESDPKYAMQSSRWKGIYGCKERPVVAIVRRSEGKVLEFYSCDSSEATVSQGKYLRTPKIDNTASIDVSERCYKSAVYRAAALTLASVGDQLYATMLEISRGMLQD